MKTTPRLSGPVLAFGIVGLTLVLLLGWYGFRHARPRPANEAGVTAISGPVAPLEASAETSPPDADVTVLPTLVNGVPPVIPISLVPFLINAENGMWLKDQQYLTVPRGTQELGGIEFQLEGMIQLQGRVSLEARKRDYRSTISILITQTNPVEGAAEIIPRGSSIASLYFLGGTRYEGRPETTIARVVWRYTDGTSASTPIQYDVQVRDWGRDAYEQPDRLPYPFTKVVWTAPDPKQANRNLRLYRVGLANPAPAKTIERLDFVSTMADTTLFVVALTLDPLRLGERPDPSRDLEPFDTVPVNLLALSVRTAADQPVAKADIRLLLRQKPGPNSPSPYVVRNLQTDNQGEVAIKYAFDNLERLEVSAAHDDHGARKMAWDLSSGDQVPAAYRLKLGDALSIGGSVVDEADLPIANVRLAFYRFWTGGDEMNSKGEQPDFLSRTATTDSQGRWQLKGLPPTLLDRIGCKVSHQEFVETNLTVTSSGTMEAQLREHTHKIVLRRGLIVRGKVTDENDNPIGDAQVWAGMVNYSGTQVAKTDAQGLFNFRNLSAGEQQFSVLAKGFKPEIKKVLLKPDMEDIRFKLGAGSVIRGMVRNEVGEPVSGVRVALESSSGGVSQEFEFSMTSGPDGRFEWDGAPNEPKNFCFLKTGYEYKRGQTLKPTEENLITLRKQRNVQGWVLDAETEKPVTKFRVGVGRTYGGDGFSADYPGMKQYSDPNGTFTLELSEERNDAVKAEADDYAEKIEALPAAQNGIVQVVLRLKASAALRGVLVNADGSPVPGATVAITKDNSMGGMSLQLRQGRLTAYDRARKIVVTEANGNFTLPSPPETGGIVVAAAEFGFASAPVEQVRNSGRLVLQGFGRIEGSIKIGGVPTAGQEFMFSLQNLGVSPDWESYRTVSDELGRFIMDKIPAGQGTVVRLIKMNNSSWMHSHPTTVLVESGKTTQVSFGDDGAVIKGRVRLEMPPAEGEALTFEGMLFTKPPPIPQKFATKEEAQAFYQSPEWKEQMKLRKNFGVAIGADGSLALDSIPPGEYTLSITASKPGSQPWEHKPFATGSIPITVPANASPYVPIAIGELVLKPVKN